MREESKVLAPTDWGQTLDVSLSFNNTGDRHATTDWELSYDVFVSRPGRDRVRCTDTGVAEAVADRSGALVRHLRRHQRDHRRGGCPAEHGDAGLGIPPLR